MLVGGAELVGAIAISHFQERNYANQFNQPPRLIIIPPISNQAEYQSTLAQQQKLELEIDRECTERLLAVGRIHVIQEHVISGLLRLLWPLGIVAAVWHLTLVAWIQFKNKSPG